MISDAFYFVYIFDYMLVSNIYHNLIRSPGNSAFC